MTGAWYFVGPATSINLSYYSKIKYCWIALSYCHVMLFKYSPVMVFKCLFEGARVFLSRNVVFLPVWVKYVIITAIMSSSKLTCLSSVFWQNPSFLMSYGKSHNWMVSGSQFSLSNITVSFATVLLNNYRLSICTLLSVTPFYHLTCGGTIVQILIALIQILLLIGQICV